MSHNLVLVGGGGHCGSCVDVIESQGRYRITGIIDLPANLGRKVFGYEVVGTDEDLATWARKDYVFLITLGQIKSPARRQEMFGTLKSLGAAFASVISPLAHISGSASVGEGTIVMHHALVAAGAGVGANCIINDKALVEHDARIGNHCHVSTGAIVNGGASVLDGAFIGSGAVVANHVSIPAGSVIGAGSVVTRSFTESGTYAGNPARMLKAP